MRVAAHLQCKHVRNRFFSVDQIIGKHAHNWELRVGRVEVRWAGAREQSWVRKRQLFFLHNYDKMKARTTIIQLSRVVVSLLLSLVVSYYH